MTKPRQPLLAATREYLERAWSSATSKRQRRILGQQLCEVMELQELEERRQLRLVRRRAHRRGACYQVDVWRACA